MDRVDVAAVLGVAVLIASTAVLDGPLVGAAFAGLLLSIALRRLYDGRPWESLAWLCWLVAAVTGLLDPGAVGFVLGFLVPTFLGVGLLIGSRTDRLPAVWTVESDQERT